MNENKTVISNQNVNDLKKAIGQLIKTQKYLLKVAKAIEFRNHSEEFKNSDWKPLMILLNMCNHTESGIEDFINNSENVFGANRGYLNRD